jgi:glutamyl-tRNA synthetase
MPLLTSHLETQLEGSLDGAGLRQNLKSSPNEDYVEKIIALIKERATFVSDFWELSKYFFLAPDSYDEKAVKKQWKEDSSTIMNQLVFILQSIEQFSSQNVEDQVKSWIAAENLSFGKVMAPLRLAVVGAMQGPHVFDILELIGCDESIARIKNAISKLN